MNTTPATDPGPALARPLTDEMLEYNRLDDSYPSWTLKERAYIKGMYLKALLRAEKAESDLAALPAEQRYVGVIKAALTQAEACMSIVEPRSDKAEYLRILGVVRDALACTSKTTS